MKTFLKQSLVVALVALGALQGFAEETGQSPWYLSVAGGASTGWNADEAFFFGLMGQGTIDNDHDWTDDVKAKSRPVVALAIGYGLPESLTPTLRLELECVYQPQSFRITSTSGFGFPIGVHTRKTDDVAYFGNVGVIGRLFGMKSYLLAGVGCNTSNAAYTVAAFQAKGGLAWALSPRCSLSFEARFITVPSYEIEPAKWGVNSRTWSGNYDFGGVYSLSGMLGLQYRF